MKSRYSFEDRGTDRLTESISEYTIKDLSNDIWHAYQSWKLVSDDENNTRPPLNYGGGIPRVASQTTKEEVVQCDSNEVFMHNLLTRR